MVPCSARSFCKLLSSSSFEYGRLWATKTRCAFSNGCWSTTGSNAFCFKTHLDLGIPTRRWPSLPELRFHTLYPAYFGSVRILQTRPTRHFPSVQLRLFRLNSSVMSYGVLFSLTTSRYISRTRSTSSVEPGTRTTRSVRTPAQVLVPNSRLYSAAIVRFSALKIELDRVLSFVKISPR